MNKSGAILEDVPLENPDNDRLGLSSFAENLANSIWEIETKECLVFSLFGPWGSGKSSCLNFVRYFINQKSKKQNIIIFQFNPWWFSRQGELLRQFFREFSLAIGKKDKFEEISNLLTDFGEVLSEVPEPSGLLKLLGKTATKLFKRKLREASKIRNDIKNNLNKSNTRIVVFIDDIDRLPPNEINSILRVLKAVADFPKTTYLLAMDKERVINALNLQHKNSGEDYLKKIVQVPFDLPIPDKVALRKLFSEQLNIIFADIDENKFEKTYWSNVFWDGIDYFLNTMRDVKLLINALKVTYPAVKGEVNPTDFVAIEAIRIFSCNIYNIIRSNPEKFAGHSGENSYPSIEDLKPFHNKYIENIPEDERKFFEGFLKRLLPKLEAIFDNSHYGPDWETNWRRQMRVCSPEFFPIYFRLAIPAGDISQNEMETILALAEDSTVFGNELVELTKKKRPDGSTKLGVFLEKMEYYTEEDIPEEHIPNILDSFFDIGDKLLVPEDEGRGIFSWGNNMRVGRIILQLLRRYDSEKERFKVIKEAVSKGEAISIIVSKITILGQQQGKYEAEKRPEDEYIISQEHLIELEKIAVTKIEESVKTNKLLKAPEMSHILYRWIDWEGKEPVKKWVNDIVKSDQGFVDFLVGFLSKSYSMGMGDRVPKEHWRLYPNMLELFIDIDKSYKRCKRILKSQPEWLKNKNKIAVETFMKGYEIKLKGKDPSSSIEWEEFDKGK